MAKKIGIIGIVVEDLSVSEKVNSVLHEYASLAVGRIGIPYREKGISVITLILDGSSEEIKALTEKLEKIPNISVKAMVTKTIK